MFITTVMKVTTIVTKSYWWNKKQFYHLLSNSLSFYVQATAFTIVFIVFVRFEYCNHEICETFLSVYFNIKYLSTFANINLDFCEFCEMNPAKRLSQKNIQRLHDTQSFFKTAIYRDYHHFKMRISWDGKDVLLNLHTSYF